MGRYYIVASIQDIEIHGIPGKMGLFRPRVEFSTDSPGINGNY